MGKVKKEMLRRNYAFEVRAEQDEKHGAIITGTPIVYESKTDLFDFFEVIDRGALDHADLTDVRFLVNHDTSKILKLSITLDTLTARILKLSSDSQSRIEPTPFYSWWEPTDCRADSAVTPVAHKISPDHRF